MAFFRIEEPNQPPKYIKSVDGANETLEFTNSTDDAYHKDFGFFADSEYEFLMFHFKNSYPELQYMKIDNGWYPQDEDVLNLVQEEDNIFGDVAIAEEGPQAPIAVGNAQEMAIAYDVVGVAPMGIVNQM